MSRRSTGLEQSLDFEDPLTFCKFLSSLTYLNRHLIGEMWLMIKLPEDVVDEDSQAAMARIHSSNRSQLNGEVGMRQIIADRLQETAATVRAGIIKVEYFPSSKKEQDWELGAWIALRKWCNLMIWDAEEASPQAQIGCVAGS